jgi:hypothetical protein
MNSHATGRRTVVASASSQVRPLPVTSGDCTATSVTWESPVRRAKVAQASKPAWSRTRFAVAVRSAWHCVGVRWELQGNTSQLRVAHPGAKASCASQFPVQRAACNCRSLRR